MVMIQLIPLPLAELNFAAVRHLGQHLCRHALGAGRVPDHPVHQAVNGAGQPGVVAPGFCRTAMTPPLHPVNRKSRRGLEQRVVLR
jgi:hypothetical protein